MFEFWHLPPWQTPPAATRDQICVDNQVVFSSLTRLNAQTHAEAGPVPQLLPGADVGANHPGQRRPPGALQAPRLPSAPASGKLYVPDPRLVFSYHFYFIHAHTFNL